MRRARDTSALRQRGVPVVEIAVGLQQRKRAMPCGPSPRNKDAATSANILLGSTDVACVALNALPPRYIRFQVDTSFYMSAEERRGMQLAIEQAVSQAAEFVRKRQRLHAIS